MKYLPYKDVFFDTPIPPLSTIKVKSCTKKIYDELTLALADKNLTLEKMSVFVDMLIENPTMRDFCKSSVATSSVFLRGYIKAIDDYCDSLPDIFAIPQKPDFTDKKPHVKLPIMSIGEHFIYEYVGIRLNEVYELDILEYRMLLADAVKMRVLNREDGKGAEYLNECYAFMHKQSTIFD